MRTTITISDETFAELLRLSGQENRTKAVQIAVEYYNRRMRLERLRAMRGTLDVVDTEALDRADLEEQARLER